MAVLDILLPAMGEGVIEATITQVLQSVGNEVEEDDSIFEIATDKVDSEIPAPEDGTITEILVNEGDVVKVGQLIARISTGGEEQEPASPVVEAKIETPKLEPVKEELEVKSSSVAETADPVEPNTFLSPLVKSIMKEEGISNAEINTINGTGLDGRVTKDDVLNYLKNRANTPVVTEKEASVPTPTAPKAPEKSAVQAAPVALNDGDEIIEMDRMRKLIADHMVDSVRISPHVTSFVETDMTAVVNWRAKNKNAFIEREGEKLTFTPIFLEAMAKAIKDFPMINASVDGTNIIKKKAVNIGMAAALPNGNLIVPVIKNADEKNLVGLAKSVNDLANRSRNNKLQPDEIQGSTITITNLGGFGNITGTPIINQPNVAILAVGAIVKKPAVIETPEGDTIGIRHKMIMSLSYDHRVVDGALGGLFLKRVSDYLEQFDTERIR